MPKLEKYTKVKGALRTPAYREVPEKDIPKYKGDRANSVEAIVVTVTLEDTTTQNFDGDETAQNRLARAYLVLQTKTAGTTMPWKTADNTIANITVNDAIAILEAAGQAQTALWFA